jgi:ADP-ribose pyrophosphatase
MLHLKRKSRLSHTTRSIYRGRVLQLGIESLTLPNGEKTDLEIVHHPGGAAVVALDAREYVCLLRQYRHAGGGWLWELPAGKLEPDEQPQATAKRELIEEAGVQADQWQSLGDILMTPGFCDEVIHLFLARELNQTTAQPEAHEVIEVHWIPFDQALAQVYDGTVRDAKSMLGLTLAEKIIRQ